MHDTAKRFEVLIAGAGVAGLEAAFALRQLARDRVGLTVMAPTDTFVYRPRTDVPQPLLLCPFAQRISP